MVNLQDFIINSKLFKTFQVDNLLMVEYKCLINDHNSDIWAHHHYFAHVFGGEKKWKTPSIEHKVSTGQTLFVKKGVTTVYQYFQQPFLVVFIFISDDFISEIVTKYADLVKHNMKSKVYDKDLMLLDDSEMLVGYFQSLMSYFNQKEKPSDQLLKLKMEEFVLQLLSNPGNEYLKQFFFSLKNQQKVTIKETMDKHYLNQLSLEQFARLSNRSLSAFRRDFIELYQVPPGKWLQNKRLNHSRFLLETSDMTIAEIVDSSGFKNRSHFARLFKKEFGHSPRSFKAFYGNIN